MTTQAHLEMLEAAAIFHEAAASETTHPVLQVRQREYAAAIRLAIRKLKSNRK